MTIKLIKSPSYVEGQGMKLSGAGGGMKIATTTAPAPVLERPDYDLGISYFSQAAYDSSGAPTDEFYVYGVPSTIAVAPNSSQWTNPVSPGGPAYYYLVQWVINYGGPFSNYFRASLDGGSNWTVATVKPELNSPIIWTGYAVDLRSLVKPGGGTITAGDIGQSYTLTIESSADGVTWLGVSNSPLTLNVVSFPG